MTPPQISHWLRAPGKAGTRRIKEDSARAIEQAMGLLRGSLDRDPDAPPDWTERDALMLDAMARVTRAIEKVGRQATRDDIITWSRGVYEELQQAGTISDGVVEFLVRNAK